MDMMQMKRQYSGIRRVSSEDVAQPNMLNVFHSSCSIESISLEISDGELID